MLRSKQAATVSRVELNQILSLQEVGESVYGLVLGGKTCTLTAAATTLTLTLVLAGMLVFQRTV